MEERRVVHERFHRHHARTAEDEQLRRLVAHRDRVAALLRASRRDAEPIAAATYRSSYAAQLWALGEASEPDPSSPAEDPSVSPLLPVGLDDDF